MLTQRRFFTANRKGRFFYKSPNFLARIVKNKAKRVAAKEGQNLIQNQ